MAPWGRFVAAVQGGYYFLTGLWSWVSLSTFEAVTGPKTDDWLVRTIGTVVMAIGAVLLLAARRPRVAPDAATLGAFAAIAFAFVDVVFVAQGQIGSIYLGDAVLEVAFALLWVRAAPLFRPPGEGRSA